MMMWNCRNKHLLPLVAAAAALLAAHAISGQSPSAGFINIDCGKKEDYSYIDPTTGLVYTSDFEYIDTGEIHDVDHLTISSGHYKQAHDLRSFPTGKRNCYTIKSGVEKGSKYLVKASFMYGNYDGKNSTPEFDLYLGVNFWTTMNLPEVSTNYIEEIITVTTSDEVSVCLIDTDCGTPFISALELRPLPTHLYHSHLTCEEASSRNLMLYMRKNYQGDTLRYPQDRYDRTWFSDLDDDFKTLTTTSPVKSRTKTYDPPSDVMKTAIYSSPSFFSTSWNPSGFDLLQRSGFLVILHFAELQELKLNETRIFNITLGDDSIVGKQFSPARLVTTSLHKLDPSTIKKFSLLATNQSTLPPIINAAEVFAVRNKTETETSNDDVDAATTIKVKYKVQKNWVGDPCSPANFKWDGLNCSTKDFTNFRIVSINLSSSGLTGEISTSFANLSELQYLDLSRNGLMGDVPDILANLIHLKFLNLSKNKLSGGIPKALLDRSVAGTLTLDYDKSGKPEEVGSGKPEEVGPGDNRKKPTIIIVIAVIVIVIVAAAMIILFLFYRKRRRPVILGKDTKCESIPGNPAPSISRNPSHPIPRNPAPSIPRNPSPPIPRNPSPPLPPVQQGSKQLTSGELEKITDNFRNEIGRGGFGPVYYGELDNKKVAVKMRSNSSGQGPREFQAEARLLTRIHHGNLVSLIGYCNEENSLSLVYEYMEKGSLRDHLAGKSGHTLTWIQRLNISIDAAQGLEYLHVGCMPAIAHRDVKTNNILLDQNLHAKLSDFGLSRFLTTDPPTHTSSKFMGTPGYVDPELAFCFIYRLPIANNLNKKSDVYSFGIVLLELITGLPAYMELSSGEKITVDEWVRPYIQGCQIREIIDKGISRDCEINSVWKVVETAMACVSPASKDRPTMTKVLADLRDSLKLAAETTSTSSIAIQLPSANNSNMPSTR